jgi:acyl carrier protein
MPIEQQLVPVIRAHLRGGPLEVPIPEDAPLVDLGLDSLGAIDLLFHIEEHFGVTFPDGLLNDGTFKTRRALQQAIEALLSESARPTASSMQP